MTLVSPFSSRLGLSYAPEGGLMSMMYGGGKLAEGLTKLVIFVTDTFLIRDLCRPLMVIHCCSKTNPMLRNLSNPIFRPWKLKNFFDLFRWKVPSSELSSTKGYPKNVCFDYGDHIFLLYLACYLFLILMLYWCYV